METFFKHSVYVFPSADPFVAMNHFCSFSRDPESEFVSLSHVAGASMNKKKSFKKIRRTLNKARKELSSDSISADWYVDIDLKKVEHFDKVSTHMYG